MQTRITGRLSWDRSERITDRYGSFNIYETATEPGCFKARVTAIVKETRISSHIGDLFRGFFPSTPEVGEQIDLGVAEVTLENCNDGEPFVRVKMKPYDGRDTDWIDPRCLYRLHDQTVEIVVGAE